MEMAQCIPLKSRGRLSTVDGCVKQVNGTNGMAKWVNTKGWLNEYRPKRVSEQQVVVNDNDQDPYGVIYRPIRCPRKKCESKNIRCYKSDPPKRYHVCKDCGWHFKSVEVDE